MTEEIKEIIDYLIDEECTRRIKCITIEESKQLLDYIKNIQQENERLNNKIKEQSLLLIEFQDMEQKVDIYKSRCENTDKIMYEFEEWLKSNFWNDDEGNESYQIEKYTTFYSVYRKLDLLKTLNKGDVNETNS